MDKFYHWFVLVIILLFLCGCNEKTATESSPPETQVPEDLQGENVILIRRWKLFEGTLPEGKQDQLPLIEEKQPVNGPWDIYGAQYIALGFPADRLELPVSSGWRINLSEIMPRNRTESGNVIFSPEGQQPPFLCVYNPSMEEIQLLLRADIAQMGIGVYELADFDLYVDGTTVSNKNQYESIWEIHTNDTSYQKTGPVLDGDWDYYCLRLVHSDCPALQYEINYGICDDVVYIENLNSRSIVCVGIDEISWKTGDGLREP